MKLYLHETIAVAEQAGGFAILLDGKPVKTPARAILAVPTQALADAIAAEWRAQGVKIDPRAMRLTALANTAIDGIARDRAAILAALAAFGAHDLLCYRSEDAALALRESMGWNPLLAWAAKRFGIRLKVTSGIAHVAQETDALARALEDFDDFALAGISPVVSITGSLVLGLALAEGRIKAGTAFALSRIDEAYQFEKWGIDEESERRAARLEAELAAAARFIALSRA